MNILPVADPDISYLPSYIRSYMMHACMRHIWRYIAIDRFQLHTYNSKTSFDWNTDTIDRIPLSTR